MPLLFEVELTITKPNQKKEAYSQKEVQEIEFWLRDTLFFKAFPVDGELVIHRVKYVSPLAGDISKLQIPLPQLRKAIADEMSSGKENIFLDDLLLLIKMVLDKEND